MPIATGGGAGKDAVRPRGGFAPGGGLGGHHPLDLGDDFAKVHGLGQDLGALGRTGPGGQGDGGEARGERARTGRREDGGRDRDRTCDPLDVNEVLSR